ncbi:MAG: hypothetical protein V4485_05840 [Pseudomonadota bacterium]
MQIQIVASASADSRASTNANAPVDVVALSQEAIGRMTMPTNEVPEYLKTIIETIDKKDPRVKDLDLSQKDLTDDDIVIICKHLKDNPHITRLSAEVNNIGPIGAEELAKNTTIKELNMYLTMTFVMLEQLR